MKICNLTLSENTRFGYSSNCFLLCSGDECAVVDPSIECDEILSAANLRDCRVKYIILTHGHFDHMHTLDALKKATGAPVYIHQHDAKCLIDPAFSLYTYFGYPETVFDAADVTLEGGEVLPLGDESITVVHTPGHTPGCVCLLSGEDMLTGDTLFDMSVGRYDFPRSDGVKLRESIKMLYRDHPDVKIYPGHGPASTMERQIKKNPFTRGLGKTN